MTVQEWSKWEIEYGRRVLDSGLEGVRSGRDAFLNGKPLTPFLSGSVGQALSPPCWDVHRHDQQLSQKRPPFCGQNTGVRFTGWCDWFWGGHGMEKPAPYTVYHE